jgi:hypothetical protein
MHSTQGLPALPGPPGNGRAYYDAGGVLVTSRWFVTPEGRYLIAELADVNLSRGPYHPLVTYTVGASFAFLFAVCVSWPFFYSDAQAWVGVAVISFVPIGLALALLRIKPRTYEIWASHRGQRMPIFWTFDETTFGQVSRALMRARELVRPSPPAPSG